MTTFKVGEIAIIQHMEGSYAVLNGAECTVIGGLGRHVGVNARMEFMDWFGYVVEISGGAAIALQPHQLRKKQPPKADDSDTRHRDTPISWDQCVWQPKREPVPA